MMNSVRRNSFPSFGTDPESKRVHKDVVIAMKKFQKPSVAAMTDVKIKKYISRMTKILIYDGKEAEGTRFIQVSEKAFLRNPQGKRICIAIFLEKHRQSLNYSEWPDIAENVILEKLVPICKTLGIDFRFQKLTGGGHHRQSLILPLELRVQREVDLSVVLTKTMEVISNDAFQPCLFRLFLPIAFSDRRQCSAQRSQSAKSLYL
mmetsp:Transcript_11571/g.28507  ORF Transcript_11571/g.28507 Transcript_11571/m.28507 type:complete len:205 (+) Transcript_11571:126-740(+)